MELRDSLEDHRLLLSGELKAVWGRHITNIGVKGRDANSLAIPVLEGLLTESPWRDLSRAAGIFELLRTSLHYFSDGSDKLDELRRRTEILFGLEDRWTLYTRMALSQIAMDGLERLDRPQYRRGRGGETAEARWRGNIYPLLADAILMLAANDFRVLAATSMPVVYVPRDVDAPPVLIGREAALQRVISSDRKVRIITGPPGVGKTGLALAAVDALADDFPDGAIQIDINGWGNGQPLTTDEAMRDILVRLGLPRESFPEELGSFYRSILSQKRLILLVDNVIEEDTVLRLHPGRRSSVLIGTSRRSLAGLGMSVDVHLEELDVLDKDNSVVLLERFLGDRAQSDVESVLTLAQYCGGLPFTLSLIGAKLASRPTLTPAEAVGVLSTKFEVLNASLPHRDISTQRIIDWSLELLSDQALHLLVTRVSLPIRHLGADLLEALNLPHWRLHMDELIDDHLIADRWGSYVVHDLISSAIVERHRGYWSADPEAHQRIVDQSIDFVENAAMAFRKAQLERRWARLTESEFLKDPRPLLPPGGAPEDDDRQERLLENCQGVMGWATLHGDGNTVLRMAGTTHELFHERGDLRSMITTRDGAWGALAAFYRNEPSEEMNAVIKRVTQSWAETTRLLVVFAARSYWPQIAAAHAAMERNDAKAAAALANTREALLLGDGTQLDQALRHIGGIPLLDVTDRDRELADQYRGFAAIENQAHLALEENDIATAVRHLEVLLSAAEASAAETGSVELMWSFEAPLVLLALLHSDAGHAAESITVLSFVRQLFASRGTRGWAGLVDELVRTIDRVATDGSELTP